MDEVLVSKLVAIGVLTTVSLVAGLLPALLLGRFGCQSRRVARSTSDIVSFLSCFGGGVFLATCLLDLIPNVRESVEDAFSHSGHQPEFPVADFIIAVGLFIILITEQTALTFKQHNDVAPHAHAHGEHNGEVSPLLAQAPGDKSPQRRYVSESANRDVAIVEERVAAGVMEKDQVTGISPGENGSVPRLEEDDGSDHHSTASQCDTEDDDCHALHSPSKMRSLLLLAALSLHSVLEGLLMGVQGTPRDVWKLFIAVVIHKSVLAFSLGVNFLKSEMGLGALLESLVVFSLMAPIGITIGIVTEELSQNFQHSIANGIIQGVATGTFLYITFFEVLPHEINTTRHRLLKVLAILLGFATISVLILLLPD